MKNPLILNIRCVCIDEYMELQRIHNNYRKLRSEGEILSIYVGAKRELYGQNKIVDKMLDKVFGDKSKPIPTERIMREEVVGVQGNADSAVTETVERVVRPEEKSSISEFAIGDRAEEFHYEDKAPDFTPATEPTHFAEEPEVAFNPNVEDYHPERGDSWKGMKVKPDITLEDVLVAQAEATDPMEAIKTEAEGEPDGADWSTNTYAG